MVSIQEYKVKVDMRMQDCGSAADKCKIETVDLLNRLADQLEALTETVRDIALTLNNEEYEEE